MQKYDTFIPADSITENQGFLTAPDQLLSVCTQKVHFFERLVFIHVVRHLIKRKIQPLRTAK